METSVITENNPSLCGECNSEKEQTNEGNWVCRECYYKFHFGDW